MRSPRLEISVETIADETAEKAIFDGLADYNESLAPDANWRALSIYARDETGALQGGLTGSSYYDWLFVKWLWVAEPYRRQGIGSKLLNRAEEVARERKVGAVYLDTFTFQAPAFYEKLGYQEFGRLEDAVHGHARIWLAKRL
ncbi:MAG TPA: GNAT family N-acetyltransferase [Methylocystis sp.]|nr:GNAT family N-acetyltransferase [Methylocystis sp.]